MKKIIFLASLFVFPLFLAAQFTPTEKGLTIIVTDGTDVGRKSVLQPPGPSSEFQAPIRSLGMTDAIQAGAFLVRPEYGLGGFLLVFCVNDSIGDEQGFLNVNGEIHRGVFRLIRQKMYAEEPIPEGMQSFRLAGTVFFLGIS